jgi:hypothetical protein
LEIANCKVKFKIKKPNPKDDIDFGSLDFAFSLDFEFHTWDLIFNLSPMTKHQLPA